LNLLDVAVIGTGPAAMAAAIACRQAGFEVEAIGRARSASSRPSATQSIHDDARPLLARLGCGDALVRSSRGRYQVGTSGTAVSANAAAGWTGQHVDRAELDATLRARAEAVGVNFASETDVAGLLFADHAVAGVRLRGGRRVGARFTIDASGRHRVGGRSASLREDHHSEPLVVLTGAVRGDAERDVPGRVSFSPERDGWTWLAVEEGPRLTWTRLRPRGALISVPESLAEREVVAPARAFSARWRVFRPTVQDGLILAGDAAGMLDPAAGEGVLTALASGLVAARAVTLALHRPALARVFLAEYDGWYYQRFGALARRLAGYYADLGIQLRVSLEPDGSVRGDATRGNPRAQAARGTSGGVEHMPQASRRVVEQIESNEPASEIVGWDDDGWRS
jgi:flavin-dependent dehydrogenase